ncbi:MAG: glycosyltransferase family 9 protein [Gemmatimonadota bacterium]
MPSTTPLRVLAIRFSSIGDILLTTPLLRAVRARYPEAHLAFLTKEPYAPLLADNPRLSDLMTLGPDESLGHLADRLRTRRYTHVLDLHGSLRTRALRLLVPGRWSGYHNHRLAREILIRTRRNVYPRDIPVPERYFDAVRKLDVRPDGEPPEFFLNERARTEATAWLAPALGDSSPLIAVAPGAAHLTKRWPVEYWRDLVGRLTARSFNVVVVGGPDDQAVANEVTLAGGGRAVTAAGKFGLQGTGAIIAASRLLVSGDTGVMHMATGVNTPVIALFGPTVRAFGFFPYSRGAVVLERDLGCRPCTAWGTERCPLGHHRCLRDIAALEVEEVVLRMVA